ncbi:MAG: hypothetical protein ACKO04_14130 [Actinomycetes bacterium]
MRRSIGALVVVCAVVLGASACGGGESSDGATTTAPNSGADSSGSASGGGSSGSSAVDAYCTKVAELAKVVEEKGINAREDVQRLSEELKTLSTEAAKSLPGNPGASKQFGECSLDASKRIAEAYKPG